MCGTTRNIKMISLCIRKFFAIKNGNARTAEYKQVRVSFVVLVRLIRRTALQFHNFNTSLTRRKSTKPQIFSWNCINMLKWQTIQNFWKRFEHNKGSLT